MNQGTLKNVTGVLIAGVLLASAYALKKILQAPVGQFETQELSYEMPRARNEIQPYSLAGRRLIRTVHTLPGQAKAISQPAPMANNAPVAKKVDPKVAAAQAAAAKKAADAKKTAAAKAAAAQRKKAQISVVTIEADKTRMSGFQENNYNNQQNGGYNPSPAVNADVDDQLLEDEKVKLSVGQWRSLLFNQPTSKHGESFLKAYQTHEVDEAAFYQISNELVGDNAADRQKLGFELLQATPSVKSFTVLLNHYQEKTPEPLHSQIYSALQSYGAVSRFGILSKLLYSSDLRVVQTAQSLLKATLASLRPNDNNGQGDGRGARGPGSTPIAAAQFNHFVPALQRLLTSNDSAVAQQAQDLLERIRAMRPA